MGENVEASQNRTVADARSVDSAEHGADLHQVLPEGAAIGGYTVRRMLGRGGFGITYEAHNRITEKQVAIKEFFPANMAWRDGASRLIYSKANAEQLEWALRKFQETTTTLCRLRHPNIVRVYDYLPANETGYMIMELLHGQTLQGWLKARSQPPSLDELRPFVDPVMDALDYVHGRGLIHRDIAPDNILITRDERPVLIDFGSVSRDVSEAQPHLVSGTVGLTKRYYTAPEQMRVKAKPTPKADIYSMAAVLYRALSGTEPADGQERVDALFHERAADPYAPMARHLPPGCPMRAAQAIDQAMALRPEDRLDKMAELQASLDEELPEKARAEARQGGAERRAAEAKEGAGIKRQAADRGAREAGYPEVAAQPPAVDEPLPGKAQEIGSVRSRRWILGGVGGGVVALGAVAVLSSGGKQAPKSAPELPQDPAPAEKTSEPKSGPLLRTFTGHTGPVRSVALAPDGRNALSGSEDKTLKLWDLANGRELRTFSGHAWIVASVAIAPDGRTALSGSLDATLKLWDLADGRELRTFKGHIDPVHSVAFAPDGRNALSGGEDKTLKLWDLANGRVLRTFRGHTEWVKSVAIAPDGLTALSGSFDKTLKLWDLASGRMLRTFTGHTDVVLSVAIAPDGRTALSGSFDRTLKLWDLASGRELRTFSGHTAPVNAATFAPNRQIALSASTDYTLKLWDLETGRDMRTFSGHTKPVRSVAFAPDGRSALSGSDDETLKLWL